MSSQDTESTPKKEQLISAEIREDGLYQTASHGGGYVSLGRKEMERIVNRSVPKISIFDILKGPLLIRKYTDGDEIVIRIKVLKKGEKIE